MKNKLKYLGFLPLLAIIGYIFYLNYEIRELDKQTKEGFKNRDNATLYFEDCSSISIDKGLIQTITDLAIDTVVKIINLILHLNRLIIMVI